MIKYCKWQSVKRPKSLFLIIQNQCMKNLLFILLTLFFMQLHSQQHSNVLIGTYTKTCESKGIYVYDFGTQTGILTHKANSEGIASPSYLSVSTDGAFVYAVNENGNESTVSAFKFNGESGALTFLNKQNSEGEDPCYIINDANNVIAANYSGGSIAVFKKNPDGSISKSVQLVQHHGKSQNPERQEKAHVHMVQFSPDRKFLLVNDLGTDKIYCYKYNPTSKDKILEPSDSFSVKKGSGPRHLTFSADGKFVYLLHELDATLTVFSYNSGRLEKIQDTNIAAEDFEGENGAAALRISPDGQFLYATNRGTANEITCFKIGTDGHLEFVERISSLGKEPRDLAIDPTGSFMLVAHQKSNEIVIFSIDKTTGKLGFTGKKTQLCEPVCLVFP
jgi:6-phosphogluconolactonase